MCHADEFFARFVDNRDASLHFVVAGEGDVDAEQEATVDLVDDFEVARQELGKHGQRPAFECLGQKRVIGVAKDAFGDRPSRIPRQLFDVDEDAHQFGDGDGRMRIVQLDGDFIGKLAEVFVGFFVAADDVVNRAANEEILLFKAQFAPLWIVIGRI